MVADDNGLSGSIPTEIGLLSTLEYLQLYVNDLTGTIPSQLGTLSSLGRLYLHNNKLTGQTPSQLGKISTLQYLYLENNKLTGTIPSQLGTLSSLRLLFLSNNKLTGPIPSELGKISTLQFLYLYDNADLTGPIPHEINQTQVDFRYSGTQIQAPSESPTASPSESPTASPSASSSESPSPTASPSESPSLSRRTTLSNLFVSYNVAIEDLETLSPPSPQYLALNWMADKDSTDLQATVSDDELVERFVLVVFYYATDGANKWNSQANFLTPSLDICSWKDNSRGVIGCNGKDSVTTLRLCKFRSSST